MNAADCAEDAEDKEQTGEIKRPHQFGERKKRCNAVFSDGERHGAERTDRRHAHNHADNLEKHVG